jgi:hypothetical protein
MLWWVGDPAGHAKNSHGTQSAFDMLSEYGIHIRHTPEANTPQAQDAAIKVITGYRDRCMFDGTPVFAVNPRFRLVSFMEAPRDDALIVDGLEVGLCWDDDRSYSNSQYPNITPWKRDPWFSHAFVTLHYSAMVHAPRDAGEQVGILTNAAAIAKARKQLLATMVPDSGTGRMRAPTEQEVTDALIGKDSRRILDARAEAARHHQEWVDVRYRQRDPKEKFRWGTEPPRGRGGYR